MSSKKKFIAPLLFLGFCFYPFLTSAQGFEIPNPFDFETLEELVSSIISFIFTVGIPLTTLMILVGAFFLLTGGGNPKQLKKGRDFIMYAAIGLAIILFARGLLSLLKNILGAP